MIPSFNTAGPCFPGEHYMLPPERRLERVLELIEERRYFTLHAGRQTGKTTSLMWLEKHLNAGGRFRALWVDLQAAREEPDPAKAFQTVLEQIALSVSRSFPELDRLNETVIGELLRNPATAVLRCLELLSAAAPLPLAVLFDEADGLVGPSMVSFLTQLRQGYIARHHWAFPSSVVLVGQRQVRDYVFSTEDRRAVTWLGTTSPFNITAEATTLAGFTRDEVAELLMQHTTATGQRFEPEAIQRIWELGEGHPWLTNALADQVVRREVKDRTKPVTAAHVDTARETVIAERRSHIDSLAARLREPRIMRILDPMITGDQTPGDVLDDDFAYVLGLGLIRLRGGRYEIANPIYREVIIRTLTFIRQAQVPVEPEWYVRADGSLNVEKLMVDWQAFWRRDGHLAAAAFNYREAGPHLMLMAFLQRVINGGGRIEREVGLGRGALDLMIFWKDERHAIEVKLRRDTETEAEALAQLSRYLDHAGLGEGWLVLFDLRKDLSWSEKLSLREVEHAGKRIRVVGC